jgi:hypothetical protein
VISFDTNPTAWEQHACTVAGHNLTNDEWHDAFATARTGKLADRFSS